MTPSWFFPVVLTVTMPSSGLDFDSLFSMTSDSAYKVSPTNKGWGKTISVHPRLAIAF